MEEARLNETIQGAIYGRNITRVTKISDFYIDATEDIDISVIKIEAVLEDKEVFEWILDNPDYNFNSVIETRFTNEELLTYFKVYYKRILFLLNKYNSKDYIIKLSEFE